MSIKIKRIEKEFILKSLSREEIDVKIHMANKYTRGKIERFTESAITIALPENEAKMFQKGDEIEVFFLFHNNRHTFTSRICALSPGSITLNQPGGVYKPSAPVRQDQCGAGYQHRI